MNVHERIAMIKRVIREAVEPEVVRLVKGMTWIVRKLLKLKG